MPKVNIRKSFKDFVVAKKTKTYCYVKKRKLKREKAKKS